jgi:hypothetical protein
MLSTNRGAVYGDLELRIALARLLEPLEQMEQSDRGTRAGVQDAVVQIDANRTERLPPTRDMIAAVLRAAANTGLPRSEIITAVRRDYGVQLTPNTATTTLLRMQRVDLVLRRELLWFLG